MKRSSRYRCCARCRSTWSSGRCSAADKEALLILAKALDLSWATTLALLFLGAPITGLRPGILTR